jgi:hypothetical protein
MKAAALPVVLFALALTSALSVGGLYVTRRIATSARTSQRGADLMLLAEGVLVRAIASWDSTARALQPTGSTTTIAVGADAYVRWSGWITRTSELDYWLVAEAVTVAKPVLRRRLGIVVRTVDGRPRPATPRAWSELP